MTMEMHAHMREVIERGATELKANGFDAFPGHDCLHVHEKATGRTAAIPWLWIQVADEGHVAKAVTNWLDAYAKPRVSVVDLAEALNRYGRHEKGCGMLRTPSRMAECSCGLHAAIRAGGVKP